MTTPTDNNFMLHHGETYTIKIAPSDVSTTSLMVSALCQISNNFTNEGFTNVSVISTNMPVFIVTATWNLANQAAGFANTDYDILSIDAKRRPRVVEDDNGRKIYYVDIGNLSADEAEKFIKERMEHHRGRLR